MKSFTIINLVIFQLAWFSAALAGQLALPVLLLLLAIHFSFTPSRRIDLRVLPLALIGWSVDLSLQQLGVVELFHPTPLWLLLLWCHLVLCLNHGLRWLSQFSPITVGAIGAIGGSSSYLAGMKLGAISSALATPSFIVWYALAWLFLLPVLVWLATQVQVSHTRASVR